MGQLVKNVFGLKMGLLGKIDVMKAFGVEKGLFGRKWGC